MSKIEVDAIDKQSGSTLTLGGSGTAVTLGTGATQTGFGRTGTVDWDTTPKTASFTADTGDGYFVNTTSSAITVTLPAGTANAIISLADYAATWQTNNVTVTPNGTDKIGGLNENAVLSTEGQSVTFVYVDSTQGWINTMDSTSNVRGAPPFIQATGGTITCCGDFKIHTFTGPGTFTVCNVAVCSADNEVSYMVVAGGGGGVLGGGGAGGFRESKSGVDTYTASPLEGATNITVTATAFPITVGAGGAGGPGSPNGSNSIFSTITSTGGGRGADYTGTGNSGGSGGGAGRDVGSGGTGNSPPVSPAQGRNGGSSVSSGPNCWTGAGGGGGAGAVGSNGTGNGSQANEQGGAGGNGVSTSITGSSVTRAGGGGGTTQGPNSVPGGAGGSGGGGAAGYGSIPASAPNAAGTAGTANTGGGGGGGGTPGSSAAAGGSGIVVIRYKFQ